MDDPETGYDLDADRLAYEVETRRAEDDEMFAAQLADMVEARGLPWVLVELATIERTEREERITRLQQLLVRIDLVEQELGRQASDQDGPP